MSADDLSTNESFDGAVELGGNGTAFVPITAPPNNVVNEAHAPTINVGTVAEIIAEDDVVAEENAVAEADAIMEDAFVSLENEVGSPDDVVVPALPPQIPPILDPMDDAASATIETLQNYDGSLESLENDDQSHDKNKKTQRKRMKYKGQGVIANSRVYLKPDSPNDVKQHHRAEDYNMMGVIVDVPNQKNGMKYEIRWNSSVCPLSLDELNVRTKIFKDDVTVDIMKKARDEYDKNYPSPPTFHLEK